MKRCTGKLAGGVTVALPRPGANLIRTQGPGPGDLNETLKLLSRIAQPAEPPQVSKTEFFEMPVQCLSGTAPTLSSRAIVTGSHADGEAP